MRFDDAINSVFCNLISESGKATVLNIKQGDVIVIKDSVGGENISFKVTVVAGRANPHAVQEPPLIKGKAESRSITRWIDGNGNLIQYNREYVLFGPSTTNPEPLISVNNVAQDQRIVHADKFLIANKSEDQRSATGSDGSVAAKPAVEDEKPGFIKSQLYNISDKGKMNIGNDIVSRALGGAYSAGVRKVADVIGGKRDTTHDWDKSKYRKQ